MAKIGAFLNVTMDGCFAGPNGEIDWFKSIPKDEQYDAETRAKAQGGNTLLFGRTTYEMMAAFWPTAMAEQVDPHFARVLRNNRKVVFSRTLERVEEGPNWRNLTLHREIDPAAVRALGDATILGSGSIVRQFIDHGLLDELELVVMPLVLGDGKRLFDGARPGEWTLRRAKSFANGVVKIDYRRP